MVILRKMLLPSFGCKGVSAWIGQLCLYLGFCLSVTACGSEETREIHRLRKVWGNASSDITLTGVTLVSKGGFIFKKKNSFILQSGDGFNWKTVKSTDESDFVYDIWGASKNNIYAAGTKTLHWDGFQWEDLSINTKNSDFNSLHHIYGIWGSSATDILFAGSIEDNGSVKQGIVARWNPTTNQGSVLRGKRRFGAISGSSANDIWALEDGSITEPSKAHHWDGLMWTSFDLSPLISDILAIDSQNAYAVGLHALWRWDGNSWKKTDSGLGEAAELYDLWGTSKDNVYAIGNDGIIINWNGSAWRAVESGTKNSLTGIWGSDNNNIFVASEFDVIKWNGSSWQKIVSIDAIFNDEEFP